MEAPTKQAWKHIPGYDSDDECSGADEEEDPIVVESRLKAILDALGERWVEPPMVEFTPAPPPKAGEDPRPQVLKRSNGGGALHAQYRLEHISAPVVRDTFLANGLTRTDGQDWCIQWSGPGMKEAAYGGLHEHQRVNHFPGSTELTRKDSMFLHLNEMAEVFGKDSFNFIPETYVLPEQVEQFLEAYESKRGLWIVKPSNSSCGRGIFVLRELDELPLHEKSVVSKYVENPLLIQGLKFDLRIYVLVTQYDPLRAYIYREGLARFASAPYSTAEEHLGDTFRHLTNYSVNKSAPEFQENKGLQADNYGHKWSLSALNRHLSCTGTDVKLMWCRIMDLVVKTLLAVEPTIGASTRHAMDHHGSCFEVYGFDILVDSNLKPWILEVNLSPSMQADSPLDWQVKSALLADAFNLVGVCQPDLKTIAACRARSKLMQARLTQRILVKERGRSFTGLNVDTRPSRPAPRPRYLAGRANRTNAPHAIPPMPLVLDSLSETHLKLLARSLQEMRRCKNGNFIRLFPTRTAVDRYARITDARSPFIRTGGKDSKYGTKLSASQLLAAILYGRPPLQCRPNPAPAALLGGLSPSPRQNAAASHRASPGRWEGLQDAAGEDNDEGDEDIQEDNGGESDASDGGLEQNLSLEEREAERLHALRAIYMLSTKDSCRLVLMEYLVRIMRVCSELSFSEKAALAQSSAFTRLSIFRRQVTVMKSSWGSLRQPEGGGAGVGGGGGGAAGGAGGPEHSQQDFEGGSLVNGIMATCLGSLSALAEESWAIGAARPSRAPEVLKAGETVRVGDYLPREFASSALGRRAVQALPLLTASDLECFLQSPSCVSEFGMLRELFASAQHIYPADRRHHNHHNHPHHGTGHSTPACLLYSPLLELLHGRGRGGGPDAPETALSMPGTPSAPTHEGSASGELQLGSGGGGVVTGAHVGGFRAASPAGMSVSSSSSQASPVRRRGASKMVPALSRAMEHRHEPSFTFDDAESLAGESDAPHSSVIGGNFAVPPKMPARYLHEPVRLSSAAGRRSTSATKASRVASRASDVWVQRGLRNIPGQQPPQQPMARYRSLPLLPELRPEENRRGGVTPYHAGQQALSSPTLGNSMAGAGSAVAMAVRSASKEFTKDGPARAKNNMVAVRPMSSARSRAHVTSAAVNSFVASMPVGSTRFSSAFLQQRRDSSENASQGGLLLFQAAPVHRVNDVGAPLLQGDQKALLQEMEVQFDDDHSIEL